MATAKGEEQSKPKQGLHDAKPRDNIVDDYPPRPYSEAITPEWRAHLEESGVTVEEAEVKFGE